METTNVLACGIYIDKLFCAINVFDRLRFCLNVILLIFEKASKTNFCFRGRIRVCLAQAARFEI